MTTANLLAAAAGVGLATAFQPIVSLPDRQVVGYEALARWPSLDDPDPGAVFAQARVSGSLVELDRQCIASAIATATNGHVRDGALLCINCEPTTGTIGRMRDGTISAGHLRVMFELTERSLLEYPHALLQKVHALRSDGFAIALDDVGAHPDSLALLDVILPDVVKLDLTLAQSQPDDKQARTVAAVLAHQERTGAVILAEGIETNDHLEQALALGATLGQGFLFGHPGPIVEQPTVTAWPPTMVARRPGMDSGSPFALLGGRTTVRTARKETMVALSHTIEMQAFRASDPPILLVALQRGMNFTGDTRRKYRDFSSSSPLVAVFGQDLPAELDTRLRSVSIDAADALCAEWSVVALGPHTAAAVIGREHDYHPGYVPSDRDRRFDFVITHDRTLVTAAARNLLDRMR